MSIRSLALTFTVMLTAVGCKPTSNDELAASFERAVKKALPGATFVAKAEADQWTVTLASGTVIDTSLDTLRRDCATTPTECDKAIGNYVSSLVAAAQPKSRFSVAQLRATVKDKTYIDNGGTPDHPLLARQWLGDLWVVVTDQSEGSRMLVPADKVGEFYGLAAPEAFSQALANVDAALAELVPVPEPFSAGSPVLSVVDANAADWMLAAKRWEPMTRRVKGRLLASIPNSHRILFAGSANRSDIEALRRVTAQLESSEPHPVSRTILRWTPNGWVLADAP